jgi:hypothetical protein
MDNQTKSNGQFSPKKDPKLPQDDHIDADTDDAMNLVRRSLLDEPVEEEPAFAPEEKKPLESSGSSWSRDKLLDDDESRFEDINLPSQDEAYIPESLQSPEEVVHRVERPGQADYKGLRNVALEDYIEPTTPDVHSSSDEKELKPLEKVLLGVTAILLTVVVFLGVSYFANNSVAASVPTSTPDAKAQVPFNVEFPGGWTFNLVKGRVENGKWEPKGAEWLQGTEFCRWIALPWSLQLEAVVGTLRPEDDIMMALNNGDSVIYKIKNIQEVPVDSVGQLGENRPCLLIILSKADSEKRWVITAITPEE